MTQKAKICDMWHMRLGELQYSTAANLIAMYKTYYNFFFSGFNEVLLLRIFLVSRKDTVSGTLYMAWPETLPIIRMALSLMMLERSKL